MCFCRNPYTYADKYRNKTTTMADKRDDKGANRRTDTHTHSDQAQGVNMVSARAPADEAGQVQQAVDGNDARGGLPHQAAAAGMVTKNNGLGETTNAQAECHEKAKQGAAEIAAEEDEPSLLNLELFNFSNGISRHDPLMNDASINVLSNDMSLGGVVAKIGSLERHNSSLNAPPLEDRSFVRHTTWGGLRFKNKQVEINFLNGHSILHKKVVYVGYAVQVLLGALLLLQSYLLGLYKRKECAYDSNEYLCTEMLSNDFNEPGPNKYDNRWDFEIALSVFTVGMILIGSVIQFIVHYTSTIKNKYWAMFSVWILYVLEAIGFCLIIVLYRGTSRFWSVRLFIVYSLLFTISVWFTGTLFIQNVVLFVVGSALYYGLSLPLVISNQELVREGDHTVFAGTLLYIVFAPLNIFLGVLLLIGAYLDELVCRRRFLQRIMITYQQDKIILEKTKNEGLQRQFLENILPPMIVDQLQMQSFKITADQLRSLSQKHRGVCILFADLVGFTTFASTVKSPTVMAYLNKLFQSYDVLCDNYHVYKVETVGDCYVAAVGIVTGKLSTMETSTQSISSMESALASVYSQALLSGDTDEDLEIVGSCNTKDMLGFAKAMQRASRETRPPGYGKSLVVRIGMHTGPCMSGIVGTRNLRFCLFGDTMNTAARMEQNGIPDCIHATQDVYKFTKEERWESRGLIDVKGKGQMQTYLLRTP